MAKEEHILKSRESYNARRRLVDKRKYEILFLVCANALAIIGSCALNKLEKRAEMGIIEQKARGELLTSEPDYVSGTRAQEEAYLQERLREAEKYEASQRVTSK